MQAVTRVTQTVTHAEGPISVWEAAQIVRGQLLSTQRTTERSRHDRLSRCDNAFVNAKINVDEATSDAWRCKNLVTYSGMFQLPIAVFFFTALICICYA